ASDLDDEAHARRRGRQARLPVGKDEAHLERAGLPARREQRQPNRTSHRRAINLSRVAPATRTVLRRPVSPRTIATCARGTPSAPASSATTAAFASPSTGGAVTASFSRSPTTGPTRSRDDRGTTCTSNVMPPASSRTASTPGPPHEQRADERGL